MSYFYKSNGKTKPIPREDYGHDDLRRLYMPFVPSRLLVDAITELHDKPSVFLDKEDCRILCWDIEDEYRIWLLCEDTDVEGRKIRFEFTRERNEKECYAHHLTYMGDDLSKLYLCDVLQAFLNMERKWWKERKSV